METDALPFEETLVAGVPFGRTTRDSAVEWLLSAVAQRRPAVPVRLANAYCVTLAHEERDYARLLLRRGVTLPDGAPVVRVMRLLSRNSGSRAERVRGPSFFRDALEGGVEQGVRHFFLGASAQTLERLTAAIEESFPGVQIVGSYAPPFAPLTDSLLDDLVQRSRESGADVVWVGMGTPKQDFVAEAIARRACIHAVGIGAAFDFQAGTVREAPTWVQNSGFEWLFRFVMEPRRLWQRYTRNNFRFLQLVTRQILRAKLGLAAKRGGAATWAPKAGGA